jgi:hypothetical protein
VLKWPMLCRPVSERGSSWVVVYALVMGAAPSSRRCRQAVLVKGINTSIQTPLVPAAPSSPWGDKYVNGG